MAGIGCYFWNQLLLLFYDYNSSHYWFICNQGYLYVKRAGFKMTDEQITIQNFRAIEAKYLLFKAQHIIGFDTGSIHYLKRKQFKNFSFIVARGYEGQSINLKYASSKDVQILKSLVFGR